MCAGGRVSHLLAGVAAGDRRIYDVVARAHGARTQLTLYYALECVGDEEPMWVLRFTYS